MTRREIEAANEAHAKETATNALRPRLLRRIVNCAPGSLQLLRALLLPSVTSNTAVAAATAGLAELNERTCGADAVKQVRAWMRWKI